jgi:hypothetical protein
LIRGDVNLHGSLKPGWAELMRAHFILDPDLEISAPLEDGPTLTFPAPAHMMQEPLVFVARSLSDAEAPEAGGQAIASLFAGDRQKIAWAWAAVWRRVAAGEAVEKIVLPPSKW